MSNFSNAETMLNGIVDLPTQRVLKAVFKYVMPDTRFGRMVVGKAATNLSGGYFSGVTPMTPNQEFTIPHTFGVPPYLLLPVLPLDQVGASMVRLTLSRPADAANVYLKSPDTGQTVFVYLEG